MYIKDERIAISVLEAVERTSENFRKVTVNYKQKEGFWVSAYWMQCEPLPLEIIEKLVQMCTSFPVRLTISISAYMLLVSFYAREEKPVGQSVF